MSAKPINHTRTSEMGIVNSPAIALNALMIVLVYLSFAHYYFYYILENVNLFLF